MSAIDLTPEEAFEIQHSLVPTDKGIQRIAQGDPISPEYADELDVSIQSLVDALGEAGYSPVIPSGSAVVSDGDAFPVTGGTVTVTVVDSVPTFEYTPE